MCQDCNRDGGSMHTLCRQAPEPRLLPAQLSLSAIFTLSVVCSAVCCQRGVSVVGGDAQPQQPACLRRGANQHINAKLKDLGHGRAMSERDDAAPGDTVVLFYKQQLDVWPSDAVWMG